jgi:hypothetical protein
MEIDVNRYYINVYIYIHINDIQGVLSTMGEHVGLVNSWQSQEK